MNDIEKLNVVLNEWCVALDGGDIDRLLATADPDIIICNERQPTTVGIQGLEDKYTPRIQAFNFESTVDVKETKLFGDFAVMVILFGVTTTNKVTGEKGGGSGRLILGFRRNQNGDWKIALDVDNNS